MEKKKPNSKTCSHLLLHTNQMKKVGDYMIPVHQDTTSARPNGTKI